MGSCLLIMVIANAKEKPCSTGLDTKAESLPNFALDKINKPTPVSITKAAPKLITAVASGGRIDITTAANKAAAEDVGATIAKGLSPIKPHTQLNQLTQQ